LKFNGLILSLEEPAKIFGHLLLFFVALTKITKSFDFANEGKKLGAFHLGQRVVDIGIKLIYHSNNFMIE
jgi:hypothetical protein